MITDLKKFVSVSATITFFMVMVFSCVPDDEVVFKGVRNISVETEGGEPILKAEALFFNPNKERMKLKEIHVDVLVNGKPSAQVRQKLKLVIPAESDFSVPVEAQLSFKELGFLDTIVNILGGKKYEVQYDGFVRVAVHGVPIKVPFTYKEELRLRF